MRPNRLLQHVLPPLILLATLPVTHAATPWRDGTPRTATAELFGWNWNSVARECTAFLGPKGYRRVKVMPANEHISDSHWWARYQPVSFRIQSWGGTRDEYARMVQACHAAGVEVEADTIINHMANGSGEGSAGTWYDSHGLSYPGVPWSGSDFHPPCIMTPTDVPSHTQCWLGRKDGDAGLPDLNTGSAYVQQHLVAHLNDMRSLGVDAFYIDAAKHIAVSELQAMLGRITPPFTVAQEVWTDNVSPVPAYQRPYFALGLVTDFNFARVIRSSFRKLSGRSLAAFNAFLASPDRVPSVSAAIFVTNHDVERSACTSTGPGGDCATLTALQPERFYPANAFMLAHPYGYPYVHSSYWFANPGDGPGDPPWAGDESTPSGCSTTVIHGRWNCAHRDWRVANMVGFRNYTDGTPLLDWQSEGDDRVAFRRGNAGFAAFNNTASWWQKTFDTGLPDGVYCNVVASASPESGQCPADTRVTVNGGRATVSIGPWGVAALHVGARLAGCDQPAPLQFPAVTDAPPGSLQESATLTVQGLGCAVTVSISGGEYRIDGGSWTQAAGRINNDQTLQVRVLASSTPGAVSEALLQVGGATARFSVTTTGADPCSGSVVCTQPVAPQAGQPLTITYRGTLASSSQLSLHWGINGWQNIRDSAMQRTATGSWSVQVTLPPDTRELDLVLTDGQRWDNNGGRDWRLPVGPCGSACDSTTVTFRVTASTVWGESVYISGNRPELGNNSQDSRMLPRCDPSSYPVWTCVLAFADGGTVDYRYLKLGLTPQAETGEPRRRTIPDSGSVVVDDGVFRR